MKALVKFQNGPGNMEVRQVEEPEPGYDQVKIKVEAASICSSDMLYWSAPDMSGRLRVPVILGHEGAGVVTEVGAGVRHVKVGDRVVAETTLETCQQCEACLEGRYNNCNGRRGLGSSANGFFAEYVIARGASVHKIPDDLDFDAASLMEPFTCAVHALLERTRIQPYHFVLVSGPGPIGLFAAQVAKLCGATVFVSGTRRGKPRLELAMKLGADAVINSNEEDVVERVMELTGGRGVDVAVECAGVESAILACLQALKKHGEYVALGAMHSGVLSQLDYNDIFAKEIRINCACSTTPASWSKTLRLVEEKKAHLAELVTHTMKLEDWEEGFQKVLNREAIKVVFHP